MSRKLIHTILMTAIVLGVLLVLVRHFQFKANTPATMPSSQGLLGD